MKTATNKPKAPRNRVGSGELVRADDQRRTKTITISACTDCPFYNFDDNGDHRKWGKHWCDHEKLNAEVPNEGAAIPPQCPLP